MLNFNLGQVYPRGTLVKCAMAGLASPAAKRLCTTATGSVKRIAIEGNIGDLYDSYFTNSLVL